MGKDRIVVSNRDEVKRRIELMIGKVDEAARKIVIAGSVMISDEAKQEFRPRPNGSRVVAKSGRVYFKSTGIYAPVPPKPTNRSGNLSNSIGRKQLTKLGPGRWMSVTGPSMKYGRRVELGGGGARPFPYMKPGYERARPQLEALYIRTWREATK